LIFTIFVGAGVYAVFVGGESISVHGFGDQKDKPEDSKKIELEKTKRKKDYKAALKGRLDKEAIIGICGSPRTLDEECYTLANEVEVKFYEMEESDEKEDTRDYINKLLMINLV
jgi:hypothetical protein